MSQSTIFQSCRDHFLGINKYFGVLVCLARRHNKLPIWGWNLGPLDLGSEALSPGHPVRRMSHILEPPRGKTNNVVSEQVQQKPGCTSTEDG